MTYLNLYFQVHQPRRIKPFRFFDIGKGSPVFDDDLNKAVVRKVARNCYLPANEMFLALIRQHPGIRLTFSISGTAMEQFQAYCPEVVESFRELASTGCVEFLGETYYHSLAVLTGQDEFRSQVEKHRNMMLSLFGARPSVFRNTELIYSDEIGRFVARMGFRGIYADGIEKILGSRSADQLYAHADAHSLRIFTRNYSLSDDVAFRFSNREWTSWPLTPKKFILWMTGHDSATKIINLGMDYETLGEHQRRHTGIFTFMKKFMAMAAQEKTVRMVTPLEAIVLLKPVQRLSSTPLTSWADKERDLSAWLGNDMQRDAFATMNKLGKEIAKSANASLLEQWRYLQTSDHFYYMSTKTGDDGGVHRYFSPWPSPYEAFIGYMNVLSDLALRLKRLRLQVRKDARLVPAKPRSAVSLHGRLPRG